MAKLEELSVGTKVIVGVDGPYGQTVEGEVIVLNNEEENPGKVVGVKLNQHIPVAHSCDGACENHYGWWSRPEYVSVVA